MLGHIISFIKNNYLEIVGIIGDFYDLFFRKEFNLFSDLFNSSVVGSV